MRALPVAQPFGSVSALPRSVIAQIFNWLCSARRTLAAFWLSLPARHERGESRREGEIDKKRLLSPALSSLLRRRGRENAVVRSKQIFRRTQLIFNLLYRAVSPHCIRQGVGWSHTSELPNAQQSATLRYLTALTTYFRQRVRGAFQHSNGCPLSPDAGRTVRMPPRTPGVPVLERDF